jgi:endoglucanase
MKNLLPFLKSILAAPGQSGFESAVATIIAAEWKPLVDEVSTSRVGSLHGLKRGSTQAKQRPSILIATHMDAIGMMVTQITAGGWLRMTQIGGVDPRVLPGTMVTIFGTEPIPGMIVQPPARLIPSSIGEDSVPMTYLLIDTGLTEKEVREKIKIGDVISYATEPIELSGDLICGHTLDNRASVAALTVALAELQSMKHDWDVWAVATTQEEETFAGAYTSAHEINPTIAIAIDVTHASGPGLRSGDAQGWQAQKLGGGVALGLGPNIHTFLYKEFTNLAEKLEIPHSLEVLPRHSGTDAYALQVAREGIPTMVLSIPLRYMHTPVEVVSIKDIERTGRLLAEFIAGLTPDYLDQIRWDE